LVDLSDMLQQQGRINKRKSSRVRFPGIGKFAEASGVTRIHAYRVLAGERKSPRLEAAWVKFQEAGK